MAHWREPCEHCGKRTTCAHYPAYANSFPARVALAAECLSSGNGIGSRAFDNCFEMYDGDFVQLALVRQADSQRQHGDTRLASGIDRAWSQSGGLAAQLIWAERFTQIPDHRIASAAAEKRKAEQARADLSQQGAQQLALI